MFKCKYLNTFLFMCILQAKLLISLHWKKLEAPSIGRWLKEMAMNMSLEKITHIIKGRYKALEDAWNPFMIFLEK